MAETPSEPTIDPRLRDYLDAEIRQAEVDFAGLPRPSGRRASATAPLATLLAAAVVLVVVVVVGSQFLGRPNTGPAVQQSDRASTLPASADTSVAPSPASSPSVGPIAAPVVDCGRIAAAPCQGAIALARVGHEVELHNAMLVVVDDACASSADCLRSFPFDSVVVFVTAGADTTGWYAFSVTGPTDLTPTKAAPLARDIPSYILTRLIALTPPSPSVEPTATPSSSGAGGAGQMLTCGEGGPEFKASVLDAPAELTGPDPAIQALHAHLASGGYPGMPADGWRTVVASDTSVTFLARAAATWWSITMAPDAAGGWQVLEEGECRLAVRLPQTMSYAEWRLDPKHPPTPGTLSVTLLATELACASGKAPGSRMQTPVVVETDTSVTITLLVRKQGNADCPSNPEVPVVAQLRAPLGSRSLLDGSTYPATAVSGQSTAEGLPLATLAPGRTPGDARFEGTLGGGATSGTACFWVSAPGLGVRTALVWPNGFSAAADPLALLGPDGQVLAQPGDSVVLGGGGPPVGATPAPAQDPCGLGSVFLVASVVEVNGKAVNIGEGSLRLVAYAASAAGSCPSGYLPSLMLVMSGGHLRLRTTDGTDLNATWPPGFTARAGNRITVVDPTGRVVTTQGVGAGNLRGEVGTGSVAICGAGSQSYP